MKMPSRVVILGGGISGLSCAWSLKKRYGSEVEIIILEKRDRLGGWIETCHNGDFLFEQGPRGLRPKGNGLHTLHLIEELQLESEVIVSDPSAAIRYLYRNQKLQKLPHSFSSLLFSPFLKSVLSAIYRDLTSPKGENRHETIHDFFVRRFGTGGLAEIMADCIVSGIYAGDPKRLVMESCFPAMSLWERQHGSVCKGLWNKRYSRLQSSGISNFVKSVQKFPLFSFRNGMETLIRRLESRLEVDIRLRCEPTEMIVHSDRVILKLGNQPSLEADYVISTIPTYALQELIDPSDTSFKELSKVSYASVAVVNLGYGKKVLGKKGFGYLVPSGEQEKILGCVWDSHIFPEQNKSTDETRLTVMLGGTQNPWIDSCTEQGCLEIALEAAHRHMGITIPPRQAKVKIATRAIPQFDLAHYTVKKKFNECLTTSRLRLAGTAFHGVAVNDCIASARRTG